MAEGLIMAEEHAIRTNNKKSKIDKTQENSEWRMCGEAEENVNVLSERSKLAQKEYKRRHVENMGAQAGDNNEKW